MLIGSHKLAALHDEARKAILPVLVDIDDAGLPFMVYETARTARRQRELYRKGASKLDGDGPHVRLAAVDIVLDLERDTGGALGPWDLGLDDGGLDGGRRKVKRPGVWAQWVALAKIVVPYHRERKVRWGGAWGAKGRLIGWDPYHIEAPGWYRLPMPPQPK